jgi:hypothetical protein
MPGNPLNWDDDAASYIREVERADNSRLEDGVRFAINSFVAGCKVDGTWNAIRACCILAGARTLAGALIPLAGPQPTNFNFVNGDYSRRTGLRGNAVNKYLNSNVSGDAVPRDDNHQAVYASLAKSASSVSAYIGQGTGVNAQGPGNWHIVAQSSTSNALTTRNRISGATACSVQNASENAGFIAQRRSSASGAGSVVVRAGSSDYLFDSTATSSDSRSLLVFCRGWPGTPSLISDARLAFYSIGTSLQLHVLESRVLTLVSSIAEALS